MVPKMKAFPSLLAALVLLLTVAGCGGGDDDGNDERAATTGSETTRTADTATTETDETTETTETERAEEPADDGGESDDADGGSGGGSSGGGSGGSDEDEQAVTDVVLAFHRALADGDGDEACSMLAGRTRQQIEKSIENAPQLKGRSCAEVIEIVAENYPDQVKRALDSVKIQKVTVNGDRATVAYKVGNLPATRMPLAREGSDWRVAALAGSAG
jgi:hypothetical protein